MGNRVTVLKSIAYDEWELGKTYLSPGLTMSLSVVEQYGRALSSPNTGLCYNAAEQWEGLVPTGLILEVATRIEPAALWFDGCFIQFLSQQMTFSSPVYLNDTIRLAMTPVAKRASDLLDCGAIDFHIVLLNQRGETVADGVWSILVSNCPEQWWPALRE